MSTEKTKKKSRAVLVGNQPYGLYIGEKRDRGAPVRRSRPLALSQLIADVVFEGKVRRGKSWDDFQDQHADAADRQVDHDARHRGSRPAAKQK